MKRLSVLIMVVLFSGTALFAGEDAYQELALQIGQAGQTLSNKKIAIIPFSYADGRSASKDGKVIAERLTMKMINLQKFEIIERSVLDKVMNELKLQASGVIDASSAQQLGKVLGVDAIVTGTLVQKMNGEIEVNARLIKTETAQAIGAVQVVVKKDWVGDAPMVQQEPVVQQSAYKQSAKRISRARGKNQYGFFDMFLGGGAPKLNLEFYNHAGNISLTSNANDAGNDLGINYSGGTVDVSRVTWNNLETDGFGPLAFRVGGFGQNVIGGDLEFSVQKHNIKPQSAKWKINNGSESNFSFGSDDYLTVTSIGLSGDLLIRHAGGKVDPYFGMGLGLSFNKIELPRVKGYTASSNFSRPVEDFGIGFMFRIPVGMRIKIADKTQLVTELRYELNSISFDRDIKSEEDSVVISGVRFMIGMGFKF